MRRNLLRTVGLLLVALLCSFQLSAQTNTMSLPYFENFDDTTTANKWYLLDVDNDGYIDAGGWKANAWSRSTMFPRSGKYDMLYRFGPNPNDDWMFSPGIEFEGGKSYRVKWWTYTSSSYTQTYSLYYGQDYTPANQTKVEDFTKKDGRWVRDVEVIDIPAGEGGIYYISWKATGQGGANILIDDVTIEEVAPVDMRVNEINGLSQATVGTEAKHTVTIENNGTDEIASVTVQLLDAENNVIGTETYTQPMRYEDVANINISWMPTTDMLGEYQLRAVVIATGDYINVNDTGYFNLNVYPFANFMVHIGDVLAPPNAHANVTQKYPLNFTAKQYETQILYFEEELDTTYGFVKAIQFYPDFSVGGSVTDRHFSIYLGTTTKTDLLGQWVMDTVLVFDTIMDFPEGAYPLYLPLKKPFLYTGGNLVVTSKGSDETNKGQLYFRTSSEHSRDNRSRYTESVGEAMFAQAGFRASAMSMASFLIESDGGQVSGTATVGGEPVANAIVTVEGTTITTTTDAEGKYILRFVPTGTHQISIYKLDFDKTIENVTVSYQSEQTVDFAMQRLVLIKVSGKVAAGTPVANAAVILKGEKVFQTLTDAAGNFEIENVYGDRVYDFEVVKEGYTIHTTPHTSGTSDEVIPDITLTACTANAPQNVVTDLNNPDWYNVNLTWEAPAAQAEELEGYYIFRDHYVVSTDSIVKVLTFTDATEQGSFVYGVSAIFDNGCVSNSATANVTMDQNPCETAINTFPYFEGFESPATPACWTQEIIENRQYWTFVEKTLTNTMYEEYIHAYFGKYSALFTSTQRNSATSLITPMFDVTNLDNPTMAFMLAQPGSGLGNDTLRVFYRLSPEDEWELLQEYWSNVMSWSQRYLRLDETSDQMQFAFIASKQQGYGILIDNFMVVNSQECSPATNLKAEQLLERTVKVTWEPPYAMNPTGYKFYKNDVLVQTFDATVNSYIDDNVTVGLNKYSVEVLYEDKADCSASPIVDVNITTIELCDPVINLHTQQNTARTINISWERPDAAGILSYSILRNGEMLVDGHSEITYTDENVDNGEYEYGVYVNYRPKGAYRYSDTITDSIFSICDPVKNLAVNYVKEENTMALTWDINVATDKEIGTYTIYRNDNEHKVVRTLFYNDWRISMGMSYEYVIIPTYDNGCVGAASDVQITTDCDQPENLEVAMTPGDQNCQAVLTWNYTAPVMSYENLRGEPFNFVSMGQMRDEANSEIVIPFKEKEGRPTAQPAPKPAPKAVISPIFDNGPFMTNPGVGYNGYDISLVDDMSGTFSVNNDMASGLMVLEDFTLTKQTYIDEMEFFSKVWDTNVSSSPIEAAYAIILKNHPFESPHTEVVWGDLNQNCISSSEFTGVYRVVSSQLDNPWHPIMSVRILVDAVLPPGTYWVAYAFTSPSLTQVAGPSAIPITIPGQDTTGNALQMSLLGTWRKVVDSYTGAPLGLPFRIYGDTTEAFNVYKDGALVATVQDTTYTDRSVSSGPHTWSVARVCYEAESEPVTKTVTCTPSTSIEDLTDEVPFNVYPNPADDKITISNKDNNLIRRVQIIDVKGTIIRNMENVQKQNMDVDVTSLQKGVYVLDVDGHRVKLIKK